MTNTRTSGRGRDVDAARPPGPTVAGYREDRLFPRIERAVAAVLRRGKVVAPVNVLVEMDLLAPEHLDDWRRGKVPYLERVIRCNLPKLSRLLRILRFHAHDLNLVPSVTAYTQLGKGPKQRLRFTKTGDPALEEAMRVTSHGLENALPAPLSDSDLGRHCTRADRRGLRFHRAPRVLRMAFATLGRHPPRPLRGSTAPSDYLPDSRASAALRTSEKQP